MSDKILAPKYPVLAGQHALARELGLEVPLPATKSEVISGTRRTVITETSVLEQYPRSYLPDGIWGNFRFAMRYEPLDLQVLGAACRAVSRTEFESWIRREPTSIFARRAWFLYEFLTDYTLDIPATMPTGYADLLDPKIHITGPRTLIQRQRINCNLLGTIGFCPLVRRTAKLAAYAGKGLAARAHAIVENCDPAILARAVHYLFTKETKSSFAIEQESPSQGRTDRFVAALAQAPAFAVSNPAAYVSLQNMIVDPRYAQTGWRTDQNFVGQTLPDFAEDVHFVCPKPEDVPGLMRSWMDTVARFESSQMDPVIAAAAAAFGFVFIHPFDDGNGRIHRFLVHHILGKMGFSPPGILFPVSAAMLRDMAAYDYALGRFSAAIMPFIDYTLLPEGMTVRNQTADLYRYWDATPQAEYLYACLEETIERDLRDEIGFLQLFDTATTQIQDIVDMPDRRASLLLRLLLQNGGKLSAAKRPMFSELTDDELTRMQDALARVQAAVEANRTEAQIT